MDDYLKLAIEIAKAQAGVRVMTEDEITLMIKALSGNLKNLSDNIQSAEEEALLPQLSSAKSIKEKSITCLECGKSFKIITRKHLATHDLDPESYKEKWGIKKTTPLVCKELQRERRKKMKDMKLWEKRKTVNSPSKRTIPPITE